jgi:hypothetical protein
VADELAEVIYSNSEISLIGMSILGDYAYMLVQALISDDAERIGQARDFAGRFDAMYDRAGQNLTAEERKQLNIDSIILTQQFRKFVLDILTVVLTKGFEVFFKPGVLNLMVNFTNFHIFLINSFLEGRQPKYEPVETELFWLPFFYTQCRYLADNIGYYARQQRERAAEFSQILIEKYTFTIELQGLVRIGTDDFPIAKAHHMEVDDILRSYAEFLVSLLLSAQKNEIPGTLSLLFLDSSYRQLCIFSTELAAFNKTAKPACDPYARRFSLI